MNSEESRGIEERPEPDRSALLVETEPAPPAARRGFLVKALALATGAAALLLPAASAVFFLADPLRRRREAGAPFLPVTSLEALPDDGKPRLFRIRADREDAWNRYLNTPVGAVYLRRSGDEVIALHTVCPHLGCFVNARPDGTYFCPCHKSEFLEDGGRGTPCVAPRGLDPLPTRVENGTIFVQFQNFLAGKAERVAVG